MGWKEYRLICLRERGEIPDQEWVVGAYVWICFSYFLRAEQISVYIYVEEGTNKRAKLNSAEKGNTNGERWGLQWDQECGTGDQA